VERSEFAGVLLLLESGTGHKFDKQSVEAWFVALEDLPLEAFKAGVKRCLQEHEGGFPAIGTVRRFAFEYLDGLPDLSSEAFERAIEAVRRYGSYGATEAKEALDDRTWTAIKRCGGWNWLCEVTPDNRTTIAAQFRKAYESMTERETSQRQLSEDVRPKLQSEENQKRIEQNLNKIGVMR